MPCFWLRDESLIGRQLGAEARPRAVIEASTKVPVHTMSMTTKDHNDCELHLRIALVLLAHAATRDILVDDDLLYIARHRCNARQQSGPDVPTH
jgi:hypothetical protein